MLARAGRWIEAAGQAFCQVAFAGVFVVFVYKVAMRYLMGDAVAWADELTVVLFVWIVFIANGFVLPDRQQIRFDLIERNVPPAARRGLALARTLLIGGLFIGCLPGAIDYIAFLWRERTPVLLLRLDAVYACFGLFMAGQAGRILVRAVRLCGRDWRDAL